MPKIKKQLHSPKGLLSHRILEGTLPPPGSENSAEESFGFRWEKEGGQDRWVWNGPEPTQEIREVFKSLRAEASEIIECAGRDPAEWEVIHRSSDNADQSYWAALLLVKLDEIGRLVNDLNAATDLDAAKELGMRAALKSLRAAFLLQAATIAEHEIPIEARPKMLAGSRQGGKRRAGTHVARDQQIYDEYLASKARQERSPAASRLSDTQLKIEAGRKHGLRRSRALEVINKLSGILAKPDKP